MPEQRSKLSTLISGVLLAVVGGLIWAVQAKLNARLGLALDPVTSATVNFGGGSAILLAVAALKLQVVRRGVIALREQLAENSLNPTVLLAGVVGSAIVLAQVLLVETIGLAPFTVTLVAGSVVSAILLDARGRGPQGRVPITPRRVVGALVVVGAVALVGVTRAPDWLAGPSALGAFAGAFAAGALIPLQQAMNASVVVASKSLLVPTLFGFLSGTIVLFGIRAFGEPLHWPRDVPWWLYAAGPLAVVFIGLAAFLATRIALLLLSAAIVVGQTAGSLVIDVLAPVISGAPMWSAGIGVGLAVVAVIVIAIPAFQVQSGPAGGSRRAP